jgi:hypothetical protein
LWFVEWRFAVVPLAFCPSWCFLAGIVPPGGFQAGLFYWRSALCGFVCA